MAASSRTSEICVADPPFRDGVGLELACLLVEWLGAPWHQEGRFGTILVGKGPLGLSPVSTQAYATLTPWRHHGGLAATAPGMAPLAQ